MSLTIAETEKGCFIVHFKAKDGYGTVTARCVW